MTIWHLTSLFCGSILLAWIIREVCSRERVGQDVQVRYGRYTRIKEPEEE